MNTKIKRLITAAIAFSGMSAPALAEVTIEAGTTVIGQQTSKQNNSLNKDFLGSIDVVLDADIGAGKLYLYLEGSSTPAISASSIVAGSNHDAGTATDKHGKGRLQLSEISYGFNLNTLDLSLGILNVTRFVDATAISNDEKSQFLASALVNNPAIPFPDYTPSLILGYGDEAAFNSTFLIANAYGLGDNPNANYRDLFTFGRDKSTGLQKGLFALGELCVPGPVNMTLGGWARSSELPQHLGGTNTRLAYGLYTNLEGSIAEATRWAGRAGWSSAKTTDEVTTHASLAIEHAYNDEHLIAFGIAWNGLSSHFRSSYVNAADPLVAELYYRWQINEFMAIAPDIQYWRHANNLSATTAGVAGGHVWVYGLRLEIGGSYQLFD